MSVMTSDYAKLKTIVNKLHVVAISQLSASAAQSALNEIFGDL